MQVAQNAAGDCVLVGGKNTMVRAFVTVLDPTFLAGLSIVGSMVVTRTQGGTVGTFPALNPSGTSNAVVVTLAGTPVDRNATASSLNFEVPGTSLPVNADLSHYTFSVTASVLNEGTGGAFDAPGYTDTDQRSAGFASGFGLSVSLVLVSASVNGSPPILASAASWNAEQTEARLPIPDGTLNVQPSTPPVIAVAADVGGDGSGYADVLNFIRTEVTKQALKPANPGDRFVVLVPPNPSPPATGSVIGLSDMDQIAVVSADAKSPNTAAHELNHTLGLQHAASPGPGCLTPADVDATLPIAADAPGWTPIDSLIEGVGTAALMGYCPTTWPTAEEFSRGYRRLAGS
jgi:hypothetical protein